MAGMAGGAYASDTFNTLKQRFSESLLHDVILNWGNVAS